MGKSKAKKIIGIIGFGNMGEAIVSQGLKSNIRKARLRLENLIVSEKNTIRKALAGKIYHVKVARDIIDLVGKSDIVIIAVKPQDIDMVLDEIGRAVHIYKKIKILIISIVAGITVKYIENKIAGQIKVIRAMPNMAASIGEGVTALAGGRFAADRDLRLAKGIFKIFGPTVDIYKEELINAVTAISGSGPAYLFYIFQAIKSAAEDLNLDKDTANKLIYHTIVGSANLLNKNKFDSQALINRVASKGGTTEAALKVFKERGLAEIINEAIRSAYKRADELSR